jgi:hypothetical protein
MALTLDEKFDMQGAGNKRMVVYEVTGDGATRDINVLDIRMQRVDYAFSVNVTNENFIPITTYSGKTISFDDEITSGKKQLVIAIGY